MSEAWRVGRPPASGWYNATRGDDVVVQRYWHDERAVWSAPWYPEQSDDARERAKAGLSAPSGEMMRWRALPTEPYLPDDSTKPTNPKDAIGNLDSNAVGSGARFNAGKPPLDLIPLGLVSEFADWSKDPKNGSGVTVWDYAAALRWLGAFQMSRGDDRTYQRGCLFRVLQSLGSPAEVWADCAAVFAYGRRKYKAWNWAKGQQWSVPIGSAGRHFTFGLLTGEEIDPESGKHHRGHVACNIVMLLFFMEAYPQGDDRREPAVPVAA